MPRIVITAEEVCAVPSGGSLDVPRGSLVTAAACEEAERRGVKLCLQDRPHESPSAHVVALGADHGGFRLKEYLKSLLLEWNYTVIDVGTDSEAAVDYPDFAEAVARAVAGGDARCGVMIDTIGVASAMAANKIRGIRAAPCTERSAAVSSREHNDANVLTLGARLTTEAAAREILAVWLATPYAGGRHQRRMDKIAALEAESNAANPAKKARA